MTAAELVERVARAAQPQYWQTIDEMISRGGDTAEAWKRIAVAQRITARAAIAETLAAILEQPRGVQAGYSLRAMIDALAAEIAIAAARQRIGES